MINLQELEALKANSLSLENARVIADQIENDLTVGGIFPKLDLGEPGEPVDHVELRLQLVQIQIDLFSQHHLHT